MLYTIRFRFFGGRELDFQAAPLLAWLRLLWRGHERGVVDLLRIVFEGAGVAGVAWKALVSSMVGSKRDLLSTVDSRNKFQAGCSTRNFGGSRHP